MPLALEPDQTIEVCLKCDEAKPAETRPAFLVRFMSSRDRRRVREHVEAALKAASDDDAQTQILSAIQIGLVGWKNLADYDPARLPDLLTDLELWELVGLLLEKTRLAELDRKNSGSPSDSGSAASVPTAATAAAPPTAATDPAPPSL